jgi:hypothetical protein
MSGVYPGSALNYNLNAIFSRIDNNATYNQPGASQTYPINLNVASSAYSNPAFSGATGSMTVPSTGLYHFKCDLFIQWNGNGTFGSTDYFWAQVINTSSSVIYGYIQLMLSGSSSVGQVTIAPVSAYLPFTSATMPFALQFYTSSATTAPKIIVRNGTIVKFSNTIA